MSFLLNFGFFAVALPDHSSGGSSMAVEHVVEARASVEHVVEARAWR